MRLHEELDLMENRRSDALSESRDLAKLLDQSDKTQIYMEMEMDKLLDKVIAPKNLLLIYVYLSLNVGFLNVICYSNQVIGPISGDNQNKPIC